MAKKPESTRAADRDRYYEAHARATGVGAGRPSDERLNKASPADTGYGKRAKPFAPGPIPDITRAPHKPSMAERPARIYAARPEAPMPTNPFDATSRVLARPTRGPMSDRAVRTDMAAKRKARSGPRRSSR